MDEPQRKPGGKVREALPPDWIEVWASRVAGDNEKAAVAPAKVRANDLRENVADMVFFLDRLERRERDKRQRRRSEPCRPARLAAPS